VNLEPTPRQISNALKRPEVQAIIAKWRGVNFKVTELAYTDEGDYVACGDLLFSDGTTANLDDARAPTVAELSLPLPSRGNVLAARAAFEQEIGRDLRRLKGQIQRARRKRDLRRDAFRRWCWRRVEDDLRTLMGLDPCDAILEQVTVLANRLVVRDVMDS